MSSESSPYELGSELFLELQKRSRPVSLPQGSFLFYQGQRADGVYVISSGQVRLSFMSATGKVLALRTVGPSSVLGLPAIVTNKPYSLNAEIVEESRVGYVPLEDLVELMRSNTAFAFQVIELLGMEVREIREALVNASVLGGPTRESAALGGRWVVPGSSLYPDKRPF